jgi:hypothetical protein
MNLPPFEKLLEIFDSSKSQNKEVSELQADFLALKEVYDFILQKIKDTDQTPPEGFQESADNSSTILCDNERETCDHKEF